MTASISMQRQAVEHILAYCELDNVSETIADAVRDAIRTLGWIERRQELIKAIEDLNRRAPVLAELLIDWPGAQIVDVRLPERDTFEEGDPDEPI